MDGNDTDPIAICGFSIKFPQEATCADSFWEMMMEKRCAMTEFPANRIDPNGFYQPSNRMNTVSRELLACVCMFVLELPINNYLNY
jgi:acyl transferase domain-containing protein